MGSSVGSLCGWSLLIPFWFFSLSLSLFPLPGLQSLRVMETCKQSDKMVEEFQEKIVSKISRKYEIYEENRQAQLQNMMKRLREHVSCPVSTQCMLSLLFLALYTISGGSGGFCFVFWLFFLCFVFLFILKFKLHRAAY